MNKKISEQKYFEEFTSLTGHKVRASTRGDTDTTKAGIIEGTVSNAMFDSFRLNTKTGQQIIRYDDLVFIEKL